MAPRRDHLPGHQCVAHIVAAIPSTFNSNSDVAPKKTDTVLSSLSPGSRLERHRGLVAQGGMEPLPIVEDFDVLQHPPVRLDAGLVSPTAQAR